MLSGLRYFSSEQTPCTPACTADWKNGCLFWELHPPKQLPFSETPPCILWTMRNFPDEMYCGLWWKPPKPDQELHNEQTSLASALVQPRAAPYHVSDSPQKPGRQLPDGDSMFLLLLATSWRCSSIWRSVHLARNINNEGWLSGGSGWNMKSSIHINDQCIPNWIPNNAKRSSLSIWLELVNDHIVGLAVFGGDCKLEIEMKHDDAVLMCQSEQTRSRYRQGSNKI